MRWIWRALSFAVVGSAVAMIAACDLDSRRWDRCERWETVCRPFCSSFCAPGGWCSPQCSTLCEPVCTLEASARPADRPPAPPAGGAALCEQCTTRDDCRSGALCLLLDGSATTGVCGAPCAADGDCPPTHACARAHDGSQCVPKSGTCDRTIVTADAGVAPPGDEDASTGHAPDAAEDVTAPALE